MAGNFFSGVASGILAGSRLVDQMEDTKSKEQDRRQKEDAWQAGKDLQNELLADQGARPGGAARNAIAQGVTTPTPPAPAAAPEAPGEWRAGSPIKTSEDIVRAARYHAQRNNLDPALALRVVKQESGFDPTARSPKGAYGLMQLMPETQRNPGYGVQGVRDDSPEENIRMGMDYLAALRDNYKGDMRLALAAYNAGPGRVDKAGGVPNIPETRDYVKRIHAPDTRMAGNPANAGLRVPGNSGLPARPTAAPAAGISGPPEGPALRDLDASQLADLYQRYQVRLAGNPYAKNLTPALQSLRNIGMARHMATFNDDPTSMAGSMAYANHYGRGLAMFGEAVDPGVFLEFARNDSQERRANNAERRADNQDLRADSAEQRAVNRDARDQESHSLDLESKRTVQALAEAERRLQQWDPVLRQLEGGLSDAAIEEADRLGFEVRNPTAGSYTLPGTDTKVASVDYEFRRKGSDGPWTKANTHDQLVRLGFEKGQLEKLRNRYSFMKQKGEFGDEELWVGDQVTGAARPIEAARTASEGISPAEEATGEQPRADAKAPSGDKGWVTRLGEWLDGAAPAAQKPAAAARKPAEGEEFDYEESDGTISRYRVENGKPVKLG